MDRNGRDRDLRRGLFEAGKFGRSDRSASSSFVASGPRSSVLSPAGVVGTLTLVGLNWLRAEAIDCASAGPGMRRAIATLWWVMLIGRPQSSCSSWRFSYWGYAAADPRTPEAESRRERVLSTDLASASAHHSRRTHRLWARDRRAAAAEARARPRDRPREGRNGCGASPIPTCPAA